MFIHKHLQKNIIDTFKKAGEEWLKLLPTLINKAQAKWMLENINPMNNLSYNYVCSSFSKKYNKEIILKIGCDKKNLTQEINATLFYRSKDFVKIIDYDLDLGAILLEKLNPGISLKSLFPTNDDRAIEITANIIKSIHKPAIDNSFPHVKDLLKELEQTNIIPKYYIIKAKELANKLFLSTRDEVLLHGDLHHDNILQNGEGFIAIDPKGVIGESAYEIGAFIKNPIPELLQAATPSLIINNRIKLFAKLLNIDEQRIKDWAYVQSVLSACWGGQNITNYMLKIADIIENLNE